MCRRVLQIGLLVVVLMSLAPAAYAKGPLGATIEGDGVDGRIVIDQRGELGQGTAMSRFVEVVGFFDLTFGESPVVSAVQPTTSLGKTRMTISWDMGEGSTIVQELYLHAGGGPVTYVAPGQQFWEEGWMTEGGWFTITGDVATALIEFGVDEAAVAHLEPETSGMKMMGREANAEPAKTAEAADGTEIVGTTNSVATVEPEPMTTATKTEAAPAANAVPANGTSTAPSEPTNIMLPLAVAILLVGGLIGMRSWRRRGRPAPR
jgi:hypothetical protein